MRDRLDRSDLLLVLVGLVAGAVFFLSLDRLWPLARLDVNASPERLISDARSFLSKQGFALERAAAASRLEVDADLLDYLTRTFGMEATQRLIAEGKPVYVYQVYLKEEGNPDAFWVTIHPAAGVIGWGRTLQDDAAGAMVDVGRARTTALSAVSAAIGLETTLYEETGQVERTRPSRRDHQFIYERHLSREPELRERLSLQIAGDDLTGVGRSLIVPERERREARRREAPVMALQMAGFLLVGVAALGALVVFLTRLQQGRVRLRPAAGWVAIIALFFLASQALRHADLLLRWDPLWPRWIATFQSLGQSMAQGAWIAFALFIVIAAGDALDREKGGEKGESFWLLGRGRLLEPSVGLASFRGFFVGLICGGVMTLAILLLQWTAGAWVAIQPQGFFFFALNSRMPAVSTLLYFLMVALIEELGYRYFAGSWLMSLTRRRWIAIVVPAALYGLTHTGLGFLPPVEPFWGRAVVFALVGCVWGWAYFRYDALTVVLSHFTADLFIFNWPRLGSGDPVMMAKAAATIAVPLIPAIALVWSGRPRPPRLVVHD